MYCVYHATAENVVVNNRYGPSSHEHYSLREETGIKIAASSYDKENTILPK